MNRIFQIIQTLLFHKITIIFNLTKVVKFEISTFLESIMLLSTKQTLENLKILTQPLQAHATIHHCGVFIVTTNQVILLNHVKIFKIL